MKKQNEIKISKIKHKQINIILNLKVFAQSGEPSTKEMQTAE